MKNRGKRVSQFYPDGDPSSLAIVEMSNWSGICYRVPRHLVKEIANEREDLKSTGIYILLGQDDDNPAAYVGEAENVHSRLQSHLSKKEFWNEVIVFVSKNNELNKAFVKYLENRVYNEALVSSRYSLKNENRPTKSSLREYEEVEMEEFLDHIKFLTGTLGHNIFIPATSEVTPEERENLGENGVFYIKNTKGANGSGMYLEGHKMVVFAGSKCAPLRSTCPPATLSVVNTLEASGVLLDGVFTKDYEFTSPSAAACVLTGGHASGNEQWKTEEKVKLGTVLAAHGRYLKE